MEIPMMFPSIIIMENDTRHLTQTCPCNCSLVCYQMAVVVGNKLPPTRHPPIHNLANARALFMQIFAYNECSFNVLLAAFQMRTIHVGTELTFNNFIWGLVRFYRNCAMSSHQLLYLVSGWCTFARPHVNSFGKPFACNRRCF